MTCTDFSVTCQWWRGAFRNSLVFRLQARTVFKPAGAVCPDLINAFHSFGEAPSQDEYPAVAGISGLCKLRESGAETGAPRKNDGIAFPVQLIQMHPNGLPVR